VEEIYLYALKLLRARDYTVAKLSEKLESRFGSVPQELIQLLLKKNFLNDRRFAENYVTKRKGRGSMAIKEELIARGVGAELAKDVLSLAVWPSLREVLAATMNRWNLRSPLQSRDAARLFRALIRLGYDEDAIREEIEQLREPQ
jgi:SOS response regulatory protein OraA/RecX